MALTVVREKRWYAVVVWFLSCLFIFTVAVQADNILPKTKFPIANLIEQAKMRDGEMVVIAGEAIGECMSRGKHAWINVSDGSACIGVWMRGQMADKVSIFGSGERTGDVVRVRGTFHRSGPEHEGETYIHVTSLSVIEHGTERQLPLPTKRVIVLLLLSVSIMILRYVDCRLTRHF